MTATLRNNYKTSFQPRLSYVNVQKLVAAGSKEKIFFEVDREAALESDSPAKGNYYLMSFDLPKGDYVIRGLSSYAKTFPIHGRFFAPIHANLSSTDPGAFYLGHVEATVRKKKEHELQAGSSVPLIDQSVAGASGGTFDIKITDQWVKDGPAFQAKFPALRAVTVRKMILPPLDKERAKKWWEAGG
jgi:hypothetical protein